MASWNITLEENALAIHSTVRRFKHLLVDLRVAERTSTELALHSRPTLHASRLLSYSQLKLQHGATCRDGGCGVSFNVQATPSTSGGK